MNTSLPFCQRCTCDDLDWNAKITLISLPFIFIGVACLTCLTLFNFLFLVNNHHYVFPEMFKYLDLLLRIKRNKEEHDII